MYLDNKYEGKMNGNDYTVDATYSYYVDANKCDNIKGLVTTCDHTKERLLYNVSVTNRTIEGCIFPAIYSRCVPLAVPIPPKAIQIPSVYLRISRASTLVIITTSLFPFPILL